MSSSPSLPPEERKTAVVVDAMYAIRQWSFHKEETFSVIGKRYLHNLLSDVPPGTELIHFCCDRYSAGGLKASEQHHRYARCRPERQFEVCGQCSRRRGVFLCVGEQISTAELFVQHVRGVKLGSWHNPLVQLVCTWAAASRKKQRVCSSQTGQWQMSVSYTHLTLPTILRV